MQYILHVKHMVIITILLVIVLISYTVTVVIFLITISMFFSTEGFSIHVVFWMKRKVRLEDAGIDPATSRMLSERSTI